MGKSIEELEKEINELYDKLNGLNKIDASLKEIAKAKTTTDGKKFNRDEKTKKLNSIFGTYGNKFTTLYSKLSIACFNWVSKKFKNRELYNEEIERNVSSDYSLELVQVLPVCLVLFDSKEKDKNDEEMSFVKYISSQLSSRIFEENVKEKNLEKTGFKRRNPVVEKILQLEKEMGITINSDESKFREIAIRNFGFSEKEIDNLMKKYFSGIIEHLDQKLNNDSDSKTLGDMTEDPAENIIGNPDSVEKIELILEKINELYNSTKAGQKNKSALYTYSILKTLLIYDLNFIKEMIEKYDFLKSNENVILHFANNQKEISKKNFAEIYENLYDTKLPVKKLSDKKKIEDLRNYLRNYLCGSDS